MEREKERANSLFKEGDLSAARDLYFSVLIDVDTYTQTHTDTHTDTPLPPWCSQIKMACLNNLSALFLRTNDLHESLRVSALALQEDPLNVKALFRQAQAYERMGKIEEAQEAIETLLSVEPDNVQALKFSSSIKSQTSVRTEPPKDESSLPPAAPSTHTPVDAESISNRSTNSYSTVNPEFSDGRDSCGDKDAVYTFMNPNWTPPAGSEQSEEYPQSSSRTSSASAAQEAERAKVRNELFVAALQTSLGATTKGEKKVSDIGRGQSGNIPIGGEVKKTIDDLSQEEDKLVQAAHARVSSKINCKTQKSSKAPKNVSRGGIKSQKVISTKAQEEWAALMGEEECIKRKAAAKLGTLGMNSKPPN